MQKQQRYQLRQQSHTLKPVVIIGSQGLTSAVHEEIDCALEARELIKIRIHSQDRELIKSITATICDEHQATLIQHIGHVILIYHASNKYR